MTHFPNENYIHSSLLANCPSVYRGTSGTQCSGGSSKRSAEYIITDFSSTRYACNAPASPRHPLYKQRGS